MLKFALAALGASAVAALGGGPNAFKSMEQLCHDQHYAYESYTLKTDDGYVLHLGRIPGAVDSTETNRPVVLFMHAQDCDMMEYVAHSPDVAPAFVMAAQGYDVWLGNNRGSQYSHAHVEYDRHSHEYWDFYQEDMARSDLPTIIDHVLKTTGQEKLTYIGHSEGTTQFFLGASLMPDYFTERVNLFVALAPVASTAHIPVPYLQKMSQHIEEIELAIVAAKFYNMFPPMYKALALEEFFCTLPHIDEVCKHMAGFMHHEGVDDPAAAETFLSHEPSGQSYRTFVYYAQQMKTGKVALYDYGAIKNKKVYGSDEPPLVPFENYNVPTGLFSGSIDNLASPEDVAWTKEQIGDNVVFAQEYLMDHFSFVVAKDMTYFTKDVVNLVQQYNPVRASLLQ